MKFAGVWPGSWRKVLGLFRRPAIVSYPCDELLKRLGLSLPLGDLNEAPEDGWLKKRKREAPLAELIATAREVKAFNVPRTQSPDFRDAKCSVDRLAGD